jgi:hypothetical protein
MAPFAPMPMILRVAIWYAVSVAATFGCFAISEKLVRRLLPGDWSETELAWLRIATFILSLKFVLAVFEYQAYDTLAYFSSLRGSGQLLRTALCSAELRWHSLNVGMMLLSSGAAVKRSRCQPPSARGVLSPAGKLSNSVHCKATNTYRRERQHAGTQQLPATQNLSCRS